MIDTNFKGTNVSSANPTSKAPAKLRWGLNNLNRSSVDHGEVNFTEVLDHEKIKDNSALEKKDHKYKKGDYDKKPGTHFLYGWLKYTATSTPKLNGMGTKWIAEDIWHLLGFSIGGYMRYTVNFLPVLICLIALAFAYIFAGYAIIKSFIDIVVMEILGTIIFGTDLDTGQKTKMVINSLCSTILLVSLQAFELAFYQAACTWADKSVTSAWGFTMFILAATIMLITGNDKVSQFFNVDTGAQHGWRAAGSVLYGAKQVGRLGMSTLAAPVKAKNLANSISDKMNTKGSIKRAANKQAKIGSKQNAVNKLAGFDLNGNKVSQPADKFGNPTDDLPQIKQLSSAKKAQDKIQGKGKQVSEKDQNRPQNGRNNIDGSDKKQKDRNVSKGKAPSRKRTSPDDFYNSNRKNKSGNTTSAFSTTSQSSNEKQHSGIVRKPSEKNKPTSRADFDSWKNRAKQYDKQNHLTNNGKKATAGVYSPVDYNPLTSAPYTYDEWKNNVNDVRTNDVPNQNLDGTDFTASNDLPPQDRPTDIPNSTYVYKKTKSPSTRPTSAPTQKLPDNDIRKSIPPKYKK